MWVECKWFSQYQRRPTTSCLTATPATIFLNIWYMLSGIHHSPIHPTAIISYTRFPPLKTKLEDVSAVLSHLQIYAIASIFFQIRPLCTTGMDEQQCT